MLMVHIYLELNFAAKLISVIAVIQSDCCQISLFLRVIFVQCLTSVERLWSFFILYLSFNQLQLIKCQLTKCFVHHSGHEIVLFLHSDFVCRGLSCCFLLSAIQIHLLKRRQTTFSNYGKGTGRKK